MKVTNSKVGSGSGDSPAKCSIEKFKVTDNKITYENQSDVSELIGPGTSNTTL